MTTRRKVIFLESVIANRAKRFSERMQGTGLERDGGLNKGHLVPSASTMRHLAHALLFAALPALNACAARPEPPRATLPTTVQPKALPVPEPAPLPVVEVPETLPRGMKPLAQEQDEQLGGSIE